MPFGSRADDVIERNVLVREPGPPAFAGTPDHTLMVRDKRLHPTPRPPRRVGQEQNTARGVEAQRGVEEPDASFRLEILPRHAGVNELASEPRHVTHAGEGGGPGVTERRRVAASAALRFAHPVPPREPNPI